MDKFFIKESCIEFHEYILQAFILKRPYFWVRRLGMLKGDYKLLKVGMLSWYMPPLDIYGFLKSREEARTAYILNFLSTVIKICSRTSKTSRNFSLMNVYLVVPCTNDSFKLKRGVSF